MDIEAALNKMKSRHDVDSEWKSQLDMMVDEYELGIDMEDEEYQ